MPVSQKQGLHGRIAQYFESTLNEENVNILLPTISFHYSNSTNMPKCIDYLELLAIFQMDNRFFPKSDEALRKLKSALVLLGSPWPTSPFKLKVSLWKLEMRYLLSRPKFRHGNAKITPIEVERAGILMRIMCTLSQCYEWEGTLNEASLAAFLMLGMAITSKSEVWMTLPFRLFS
ncbi:hypothetical protein BC829DRAFT_396508 [Chytridium lagenaria]|nr:hypothetical protein BC829DRAFT_396508 [Chytridium lagenaria]